jgi:hypothetical protein
VPSALLFSVLLVLAQKDEEAARAIRQAADHPPYDGPCGATGGYAQLLAKYAPLIERAKQADSGTTPEIEAVRYLQAKAADYQRVAYRTLAEIRDRNSVAPEPTEFENEARWFECLGDYRDARAESARLKALALELRAKDAERRRCEQDPACRERQAAQDHERDVRELVTEVCSEIEERREMKDHLRKDMRAADPSEVRGMRQTIRFLDEMIAEKLKMYREATGTRFAPTLCK